MRPVELLKKIAPKARPEYVQAFEQGDALFLKYGITTPRRLAELMAQLMAESGKFTLYRESGNYSAKRIVEVFGPGRHSAAITPAEAEKLAMNGPALFERVYGQGNPKKAAELGNTKAGDGWKYRGNGPLQTTGRYNHWLMGKACGVDFETYPELVTDPRYVLFPILVEWDNAKLNAYADKADTLSISRAINLGNPKSTKMPNGAADRAAFAKSIFPLIDKVDLVSAVEPKTGVTPISTPTVITMSVSTASATAVAAGWNWWEIGLTGVVAVIVGFGIAKLISYMKGK